MKVVLFCGGFGTRLRDGPDVDPKPLVNVGPRPIVWHLMHYYAAHGHTDFVLCLGFKGQAIRDWFLSYGRGSMDEIVMEGDGGIVWPPRSDIADWRITFVETGLHSNIAQRLVRVRHLLEDEPIFLANYADGLTDLPLDRFIDGFERSGATAGFVSVRPDYSTHAVMSDEDGLVRSVHRADDIDLWINGGYMALRQGIFDVIGPDDELVERPFGRLVEKRRLWTHRHHGFWRPMDTFKDKLELERMWALGDRPWVVAPEATGLLPEPVARVSGPDR